MPAIMRRTCRHLLPGPHSALLAAVLALSALPAAADAQTITCDSGSTPALCVISSRKDFTNVAQATFNFGGQALDIKNNGRIKVTPGSMTIIAPSVRVEAGGNIQAPGTNGTAGNVTITTPGAFNVDATGVIDVSAGTQGGQIVVSAGGAIQVDGTITAAANKDTGNAGSVQLASSGAATVSTTALVSSAGGANGGATTITAGGDLHVGVSAAPKITTAGSTNSGPLQLTTTGTGGIFIDGVVRTSTASGGTPPTTAGKMTITSAAGLNVSTTGLLDASGGNSGGNVNITAKGAVRLEAGSAVTASIDTSGNFQAGNVNICGAIDAMNRCLTPSGGTIDVLGCAPPTCMATVRAEGSTGQASGGTINLTATGNVTLAGTAPLSVAGGDQFAGGGNLIVLTSGTLTVTGPLSAEGGDGGFIELQANGDVSTSASAELNANAAGAFGDGGLVSVISVNGGVNLQGLVTGDAAGSFQEGGGQGGEFDIIAAGDATLAGAVSLLGPLPDGDGGFLDFTVDGNFTQTGAVNAQALGDGCGDDSSLDAGGMVQLGAWNVGGGLCGGSVTVTSQASLFANGEINADSDAGQAGAVDLSGMLVDVVGNLHASATGVDATGGEVDLHGCTLTLELDSKVVSTGFQGLNVLEANGLMTIAGRVESAANQFLYGDANQPPVKLGSGVIIPPANPLGELVPNLGPCIAPTTTTTSSTTSTSLTTTTSSSAPTTVPSTTLVSTSSTSTSTSTTTSSSALVSTTSTTSSSSTSSTAGSTSSTSTSTSTTTSTTVLNCAGLCGNGHLDFQCNETCDPGSAGGGFVGGCAPADCVDCHCANQTTTSTSSSSSTSSSTSSTALVSTTSSSTTTSVFLTTTSTSTSTSSSLTTTSTSTSSTAHVTTTSTSTSSTTSLPPPECTSTTASTCPDDGDPCTEPVCVNGRCDTEQVTGDGAVTCHLDKLERDLRNASATDLGGTTAQAKFLSRVAGVRKTIAAGDPTTPKGRRTLKRAIKQLRAFVHVVNRGTKRAKHKIEAGLGDRLVTNANDAMTNLLPLTQ